MLGRAKADVIDLKPQAVLVLAGTNDLARGVSTNAIEGNLTMIADLAEAHHITPLFASLLPVSDYHKDVNPQFAQTVRRPPAGILELNTWLKSFCEQRHFAYVDYYSALVDTNGFLQADASDDGLHPNAKGYRLMSPVALAAIDRVTSASAVKPAKKRIRTAPAPRAEKPAPVTELSNPAPSPAASQTAQVDKANDTAANQAVKEQERQQALERKQAQAKKADDKKQAEKQAADKKAADKKAAEEKKQADAKKKADDKSTQKKKGVKAWLTKDHT
jgi:flagellar biosynthesis GTPase FlhF